MPAKSARQARYMAACLHSPKHMRGCPKGMTKEQLREFAELPRPGQAKVKMPTWLDALGKPKHG